MTTIEFDFQALIHDRTGKKVAIIIALRCSVGAGLRKAKELVDASQINPMKIRMNITQFGIFMAKIYERDAENHVCISNVKTFDDEKILYDFTGNMKGE